MIDNPRSARIRAATKLHKKSARSKTGLFLIEGPQALSEALTHIPELIHQVFVSEIAVKRLDTLMKTLDREHSIEVFTVTNQVMQHMSDTVTPQGVIAICRQPETDISLLEDQTLQSVVILEQVRDPGNAGTIIRVADAAGFDAVILTTKSVDPFNPKVVRSTTGSLFHIPIITNIGVNDAIHQMKDRGLKILAADVKGEYLDPKKHQQQLSAPHAWLFGNEAHGLDDEILDETDLVIKIPIFGEAESLNLATAASICVYQSAFSRERTRITPKNRASFRHAEPFS